MQQQYPPPPQYYPHAPALASPTPMDVPVLDGYEFVREIRPRASFGQAAQVLVYRDVKTEFMYACKLLHIPTTVEHANNVRREMCNLLAANFPGCARFREARIVGNAETSEPQYVAILAEYVDGGDLHEFLDRRLREGRPLLDRERAAYFKQLVVAVAAMHKKRLFHRDLKLDNILVTSGTYGRQRFHLMKICDFGMSKSDSDSVCRSLVGTYSYRPPEIIMSRGVQEYNGQKADVWSLGVVLYIMRYRKWPFGGAQRSATDHSTLMHIVKREFVEDVPNAQEPCGSLILWMLKTDPARRPTMEQVLDHEFLAGVEVPWGIDATCDHMGPQQSKEQLMAVADYITNYAAQIDANMTEPTVDDIDHFAAAEPIDELDEFLGPEA